MILPLGPSWRSSKSIPKRCRTTATSASHFLEDVPSEIDISEDPTVSPAISTSPFSEDVSGETLIFSIRRLKRKPPRSRFCEDVSSETLLFRTFPDMNGKRVKVKSCARSRSIITIECNVGELAERPQGTTIGTRSLEIH